MGRDLNHLAHLFLSPAGPDQRAGNFAADLVKGRLEGRFCEGLTSGLLQHRKVDAFVDGHRGLLPLRQGLEPRFRRYSDVLFDVVADRLLALEWERWSTVLFADFAEGVYADLSVPQPSLPVRFEEMSERFRLHDGLSWSMDPAYIVRTLRFLSARLRKENPLEEAGVEIERCRDLFEAAFACVWPDTIRFVRDLDPGAAPCARTD